MTEHADMNTCPTCPNDLVCHDQGECLRPTPETDAIRLRQEGLLCGEANLQWAEKLERERDEAREQLASEKATRNAIIAKGIETERQLAEAREAFAIATSQLVQVQGELRQAREENARLREVVKEAHDAIERLLDKGHDDRCAWINYANAACTCGDWAGHIVLRNLKPFVAP